jgi:hypothetical protein
MSTVTRETPNLIEVIGRRIVNAIVEAGVDGGDAEDMALDLIDQARKQGLDLSAHETDRLMAIVDDYR